MLILGARVLFDLGLVGVADVAHAVGFPVCCWRCKRPSKWPGPVIFGTKGFACSEAENFSLPLPPLINL